MAPKQMKLIGTDSEKIQLKGYGRDQMGASFADYGLTIFHDDGNIEKCVLHMYDRSIDVEYYKEEAICRETSPSDIKDDNSKSIVEDIAASVNWHFNTNNKKTCLDLMVKLYQTVQRESGKILLDLPASNCQSVGLAFTCMALYFDNGDKDINSVAAENAYYCLAKSHIENKNTYSLPAIFSMLERTPTLLTDKFISSWCSMAEKQVGMPIGLMLGGNPFKDKHLQDFRDQAIGFMNHVKYYALSLFYNIEDRKYIIPTDMPYFLPTEQEIISFLLSIKNEEEFDVDNYLSLGKSHFDSVFKECEDTLSKC